MKWMAMPGMGRPGHSTRKATVHAGGRDPGNRRLPPFDFLISLSGRVGRPAHATPVRNDPLLRKWGRTFGSRKTGAYHSTGGERATP